MNQEQIKKAKEQIEEVKKTAIEAINKVNINEQGQLINTFVLFNFVNGQPQFPITTGADRDIFKAMAEDFLLFMEMREKEEKIRNIQDEKLRARLLNNLSNGVK